MSPANMKMVENKIRPPSVMRALADAAALRSVVFNAQTEEELCDQAEIELLAIPDLLEFLK